MGLFDRIRKKKIDQETKVNRKKKDKSCTADKYPEQEAFAKDTPDTEENLLQQVTECLPGLVNALRKEEWILSVYKDKIKVYKLDAHGEMNPFDTYFCDSNGFYENRERAYHVTVASLGSLENNFIGLYCYLNVARNHVEKEIAEDIVQITDKTSLDEAYQIYAKYMDISYLNANLNLDPTREVNDAFNLSVDGEWLAINYILDNYYIPVTEVNRQDALYI